MSASVCAANRAVTVARDESSQASLRCRGLEESLVNLVREREEMRRELEVVGRERERGEREREEYMAKMSAHRDRVSLAEENTSSHQELAKLLAKKRELETRSKSYILTVYSQAILCLLQELPTSLKEEVD